MGFLGEFTLILFCTVLVFNFARLVPYCMLMFCQNVHVGCFELSVWFFKYTVPDDDNILLCRKLVITRLTLD